MEWGRGEGVVEVVDLGRAFRLEVGHLSVWDVMLRCGGLDFCCQGYVVRSLESFGLFVGAGRNGVWDEDFCVGVDWVGGGVVGVGCAGRSVVALGVGFGGRIGRGGVGLNVQGRMGDD